MPKIMLYDTETTGLPAWHSPSDHPDQPHLVQFSAVVFDGSPDREIAYVDLLIRPDGWIISDEVAELHGITHARAATDGQPENLAVAEYLRLTRMADVVCAFGISFDERMMRIAMLRSGMTKAACDALAATLKTHCVMKQATPLCKLPPSDKMMATGRKTFKTPNLTEAVRALLGEEIEGAHDARVDLYYTGRLYFHMNKLQAPVG